jgi:hypothetical protein
LLIGILIALVVLVIVLGYLMKPRFHKKARLNIIQGDYPLYEEIKPSFFNKCIPYYAERYRYGNKYLFKAIRDKRGILLQCGEKETVYMDDEEKECKGDFVRIKKNFIFEKVSSGQPGDNNVTLKYLES